MSAQWVLFQRARTPAGWPTGSTVHRLDCASLPKDYAPGEDDVMTLPEMLAVAGHHRDVGVRVISPIKVCKRCAQEVRDALEMDLPPVACPACDGTGKLTHPKGVPAMCAACMGSGEWSNA